MIYLHTQTQRQLILIEQQGNYGLFTEYLEPGVAKIRMDQVETAFDANTRDYLSRANL